MDYYMDYYMDDEELDVEIQNLVIGERERQLDAEGGGVDIEGEDELLNNDQDNPLDLSARRVDQPPEDQVMPHNIVRPDRQLPWARYPAVLKFPPPAQGVRPPPAQGVRPPPAHGVRPPLAQGVRLPPAHGMRPPPAQGVRPPPPRGIAPPPRGAIPPVEPPAEPSEAGNEYQDSRRGARGGQENRRQYWNRNRNRVNLYERNMNNFTTYMASQVAAINTLTQLEQKKK